MTTISKTRLTCAMAAAFAVVAGACWMATTAFPLSAAPQAVEDAAGVAVNMNGGQLMHRSAVPYPAAALAKGIEGTVVVQVKLDGNGEVSDATILSGPDELRKAVLQSVLGWHFEKNAGSSTRTVDIAFVKPANTAAGALSGAPAVHAVPAPPPPPPPPPPAPPTTGRLDHIDVTGLSDSARAELLSQLPIQEGGEWTAQTFVAVKQAVTAFDSHLTTGLARSNGELTLHIALANSGMFNPMPVFTAPVPQVAQAAPTDGVYRVGNGVAPPSVLSKVDPEYPGGEPSGLAATVMLSVVIGTNGTAEDIKVVKSADSAFDTNAVAAVSKWVFRPGTLDGAPVKVRAQIEVNFRKL